MAIPASVRAVVLGSVLLGSPLGLPEVQGQGVCIPTPIVGTTVTLAWTAPVQPAGVTTTGYTVEQQMGTGAWSALGPLASAATTLVVTNLTPNTTYAWRLTALARLANGTITKSGYAGNGTPPPCVAVVVVNPPTNFSATPQ